MKINEMFFFKYEMLHFIFFLIYIMISKHEFVYEFKHELQYEYCMNSKNESVYEYVYELQYELLYLKRYMNYFMKSNAIHVK